MRKRVKRPGKKTGTLMKGENKPARAKAETRLEHPKAAMFPKATQRCVVQRHAVVSVVTHQNGA